MSPLFLCQFSILFLMLSTKGAISFSCVDVIEELFLKISETLLMSSYNVLMFSSFFTNSINENKVFI